MNKEARDFINILNLKSQLINFDDRRLMELYEKDYDNYIMFLNSVGLLINNELAFLLLNNEEYIDKILSVASVHRFTTEDNDVKNLVNQIIVACNEIIRMPESEKYAYRYDYFVKQEDMRDTNFYEEEDLITALNFDAFLSYVLTHSDMEYLYACDNFETLISLNYFLNMCPSFFDDETVLSNTIEKLDYMINDSKKKKLNRRMSVDIYADDLKGRIQKVLKKGE